MTDADPFFDLYKKARNRMRKVSPIAFADHTIKALHAAHHGPIEILRKYQPWNLLLALKWAFQESDATAHRRPAATINDFHVVVNLLTEMDGIGPPFRDFEHAMLFMRKLAFQQFDLQKDVLAGAVARQDILFTNLPREHRFQKRFLEITGVSIPDFVELCAGVLTLLLNTTKLRFIRKSDFDSLTPRLPAGTLDNFLRHLSKDIAEFHSWLNQERFKAIAVSDQKFLPSPFLEAPLLDVGHHWVIISPSVLMRSLEHVVYRTLRQEDVSGFGTIFGPLFERYVGQCLTSSGVHYEDEAYLQGKLPGSGKCVDFVVFEAAHNILIDAKAVEVSPRGRLSHQPEVILQTLKASAIKAITQGMVTQRRIKQAGLPGLVAKDGESTFLVVVTVENLYLGNSRVFQTIFGKHILPGLEAEFGSPLPVSFENIFFLTIKELEELLSRVHRGLTTMGADLRFAKEQDAAKPSGTMVFEQHFENGDNSKLLPVVQAGIDNLFDRCIRRFPPEQRLEA